MSSTEDVILEIENTPLKCNKKDLIEHSDYFKAMFQGNFAERNKTSIKLEGIDLKSMNIILTLLWDETYPVENEDILMVLQVSCMLQFERIRQTCIDRLTEILSMENCLKIWHMTESLELKPLYLKAKNLSLLEFMVIKDYESILELNLKQLHEYLANANLICNSELEVFSTCMKWFYENHKLPNEHDKMTVILSLMNCVDFTSIPDSDIKEIMTFPDINGNTFIVQILNCIINKRNNIIEGFNSDVVTIAERFLKCKRRCKYTNTDPFFFVKNVNSKIGQNLQIYLDEYRRRRKYMRFDNADGKGALQSASMLLFDKKNVNFIRCIDLSEDKFNGIEGFHVVGYKEHIFMFGGEVALGSGNWNSNFWVYDTIKERWERKTKLPFGRRHFRSQICGKYLYIIGGTGNFRIIQDNMFWYNYMDNIWSKQIMLPCPGIQMKCCNYKNQLLLLNVDNNCGYLFVQQNCSFVLIKICDKDKLVPSFPDIFTVFSYEDRIFIKGPCLIEFKLIEEEQELRVVNYHYLKPLSCDLMESSICRDTVYTLYKFIESKTITIDSFSMVTFETTILFEYLDQDSSVVTVDQSKYTFDMSTKLFSLQHHYKVEEDTFINSLDI